MGSQRRRGGPADSREGREVKLLKTTNLCYSHVPVLQNKHHYSVLQICTNKKYKNTNYLIIHFVVKSVYQSIHNGLE